MKQELTEYELIPEDWGGSTICAAAAATSKRRNSGSLSEMVLRQQKFNKGVKSEIRTVRQEGLVIEAELDKGKGSVATVLCFRKVLCQCRRCNRGRKRTWSRSCDDGR